MEALRRFPPEVSELTFTNLYVWRRSRPVWIADVEGVLVFICADENGGRYILGQPLGGHPEPDFLRSGIPDLRGYIRVPEETTHFLEQRGMAVQPDDDNSDYVYRTSDLADLAGARYHKKRNLIKQCQEAHHCYYRAITSQNIPDCIAALDIWCFARRDDLTASMLAEYRAIRDLFDHYEEWELRGGVVLIDGCVQAYAVGETLNPTTLVCHFEKANPEITGLSQTLNQLFATHAAQGFEFINREQDLGIPGLRQAKQSYYPHHRVLKYIARFGGT